MVFEEEVALEQAMQEIGENFAIADEAIPKVLAERDTENARLKAIIAAHPAAVEAAWNECWKTRLLACLNANGSESDGARKRYWNTSAAKAALAAKAAKTPPTEAELLALDAEKGE